MRATWAATVWEVRARIAEQAWELRGNGHNNTTVRSVIQTYAITIVSAFQGRIWR